MDDILFYHDNLEEHIEKVKQVCGILNHHGLQINIKKTKLLKQQADFLGYTISESQITPTKDKVQAIHNWNVPTTSTEVRSIVNFTNFFRQFIPNLSEYTAPLTDLIKDKAAKHTKIEHTEASRKAFESLKQHLIRLPKIFIYDPDKTTYIFTDSSDRAIGGFICQSHHIDGIDTTASSSRFLDVLGAYSPEIRYLPGKKNYILSRYQTTNTADQSEKLKPPNQCALYYLKI